MRIRAESGCAVQHREYIASHPVRPGMETAAGRVLLTGEAVHIPDAVADPDYSYGIAPQLGKFRALFTDIADFTPLVESLDSETLARLLGEYLAIMTEIVFDHEGTVAKIIGDAIHVLFGAPVEQPDAAGRAIACALELDQRAEAFRCEWRARGVALGATRIGVHAGPAIVGNFGGGRLFDYTAYGETINAAARLEAINKQLGTRICVSAVAAARAGDFCGRPVGDLALRGMSEPLRAYEPLAAADKESAAATAYLEAFAKLEARDPSALSAFAALVGARPADALAQYHLIAPAERRHRRADRDGVAAPPDSVYCFPYQARTHASGPRRYPSARRG